MKYHIIINHMLLMLLISTSLIVARENSLAQRDSNDCWLQVGKLCADQIKARSICAKKSDFQCLCTTTARLKSAVAENISTNSVCAQELRALRATVNALIANSVCAHAVNTDALCTTTINANYACIAGPVINCNPFTGAAAVDPAYTYTLGDPIIFQATNPLLDPNGDILQTATEGTVYRAPRSGVYAFEIQITSSRLQGPNVIAGQPVSKPVFFVNDVVRRDAETAYLSFSNRQTARLSGLTRLTQGDHAHIKFFVDVIDPVLGEIHYPGTVELLPADINAFRGSGCFMIFYYLGDSPCIGCPTGPCISEPNQCASEPFDCPTITVDCSPCNLDCLECEPCA